MRSPLHAAVLVLVLLTACVAAGAAAAPTTPQVALAMLNELLGA